MILGHFPGLPGPGGAWERPRPGPRSICTDCQPGRPNLKPFREALETALELYSFVLLCSSGLLGFSVAFRVCVGFADPRAHILHAVHVGFG
jgi:hypothetical protein